MNKITKLLSSLSALIIIVTSLSACGSENKATPEDTLIVGVVEKLVTLDPAGAYDQGSKQIEDQVYSKLFDFPLGKTKPEADLAETYSYTNGGKDFVVKIKPGITFENGHKLGASDVKFSMDRIKKINDPNGPASMLDGIKEVKVIDDLTVDFVLVNKNDITIIDCLSVNAGPIQDEEVFPADKLMEDNAIVSAKPFSGAYGISSYVKNEAVEFVANPTYKGFYGAPKIKTVDYRYYTTPSNLVLDIKSGKVDFTIGSLSAQDEQTIKTVEGIKITSAPGGRFDFLTFNIATQPFGTSQKDANNDKAAAVRKAIAAIIDREEISKNAFKGSYEPIYSIIGGGLNGQVETYKSTYGDLQGGPSLDQAKKFLQDAKVDTKSPIELNIQYNTDHYSAESTEEYNNIKSQLEESGLFNVTLGTTEWTQYQTDRVNDPNNGSIGKYPAYQLGWYADYSDADNFLRPFFGESQFINNGYANKEVQSILAKEPGILDEAKRMEAIKKVQDLVTNDCPIIPVVQGNIIAYSKSEVQGVDSLINAAQAYHFVGLSK